MVKCAVQGRLDEKETHTSHSRLAQAMNMSIDMDNDTAHLRLPVRIDAPLDEGEEKVPSEISLVDAADEPFLTVAAGGSDRVPREIEARVALAYAQDLCRQLNEVYQILLDAAAEHPSPPPETRVEYWIRARRSNHGRSLSDWKMQVHVVSEDGETLTEAEGPVDTMSAEEDRNVSDQIVALALNRAEDQLRMRSRKP